MSGRLLAAVAALALAAAAATAAPAPATGAACGSAAAGGTLSLEVGGRQRTVVVHVPPGRSGKTPLPLVLNLHGTSSTAAQEEAFTGMDATADADGFVVAYPQGAIPISSLLGSGYAWNVPREPLAGGGAVPAAAPDDVAFLRDLVGLLRARDCIDPRRVYATGFSGGARMASALACDAAGTFAAVAAVSGLRAPSPCRAARAVPILAIHGTADPVDPYAGHGQAYWTYGVAEAAQRWAARDGCVSRPASSAPRRGVALAVYGRCRDHAAVELYTVQGGGHTWPGGPPLPRRVLRLLGTESRALDADAVIWRFFSSHRLA